jgi:hypothetical protein
VNVADPVGRTAGWVLLMFLVAGCSLIFAQEGPGHPLTVETSLWMVAGLLMPESPDFYQVSLGYRLGAKDALFLNAITWKYGAPLGIPFGPDFESADEDYPGYVRGFGLGLAYQRFLWEGLYSALWVTPFLQRFYSDDDRYIQSGFQLFLQLQLGYQVQLAGERFYIKPALSFNCWPVNTSLPDAFEQKERGWPNYFLFEPHLNVGFRF